MKNIIINIEGDNIGIVSDFIISYLESCTLVSDFSVCFDVPCYQCKFCADE